MFLRSTLLLLGVLAVASNARAAESYDNCIGFIDTLPAATATPGVWCLRKNLVATTKSAPAITLSGNNITLDCNGFTVDSAGAEVGISAQGSYANITVRNCNVRNFMSGIVVGSSNAVIEHNRVRGAKARGISVSGDGSVVRHNIVSGTARPDQDLSPAYGIQTTGDIDISDNAVLGVTALNEAYGIYSTDNTGGSVSRNRVRGLLSTSIARAYGIDTSTNGSRVTLRDNDVSSVGGYWGIKCHYTHRASGNVVAGFQLGLMGCGDAGGNDVVP